MSIKSVRNAIKQAQKPIPGTYDNGFVFKDEAKAIVAEAKKNGVTRGEVREMVKFRNKKFNDVMILRDAKPVIDAFIRRNKGTAEDVLARHQSHLMSIPSVHSVGIGKDPSSGNKVIVVYARSRYVDIPRTLEGYAVKTVITPPFIPE